MLFRGPDRRIASVPTRQGEATMLSAAVKMGSSKIVAALLGAKGNPNAAKGFEARQSLSRKIDIQKRKEGVEGAGGEGGT
jgi:hypothetical protein